MQYFLLVSRSLRSCRNLVASLVTIRWFVIQLRWYVPGISIFALSGPSWREFKDENVSVYLIKRKDNNLSCSSKYPPHLWTIPLYTTFHSDHFIILPIYLMLVRKVTDLLLNQGACVAFPAMCYKPSAVLYSPGVQYCNDVNRFMCRARLYRVSLGVFGLHWESRFEIVSQPLKSFNNY